VAATIRTRRLAISTAFIAAVLGSVILATGAQAAPGDLDTTFSGDGKQTTALGGFSEAKAVAVQPDGKVVVVGRGGPGSNDVALARYNPNGALDTSFSGDGRQTTDFGGNDEATGVALQEDGKIVVVGGTGSNFAIARYNPTGGLDTSFSGDGRQTTDFGKEDEASGVAIQGNGKIVVVGTATAPSTGANPNFVLARYNPGGSLDTSFSGDGKQTTDFGRSDQATGVALQANGKIVVVGTAGTATGEDVALARYNPNGSLDTSFSGDGTRRTDFGGTSDATGVAIQGNGKIVVVGGTGSDFAIARYNPNGSLDTTFSGDGKQTTAFAGGDGASGVAIQGDGKIVAVGAAGGGQANFAVARYNPNGSLDTSFSGDGRQTTDFGKEDEASGVAIQGTGKIVAIGDTESNATGSRFAVSRYNPSGSLDTTFSGDGRQTTDFGAYRDGAEAVALQGDGKIVVVGVAGGTSSDDFAIARYNPNGSLDTTFSGDGMQGTTFSGWDYANATGVAIQGDGKIVVVGLAGGPMYSAAFAIARYNPNGSLDTSFSGDGKETTAFTGSDEARGVAIQGNGKIVAVGTTSDPIDGTGEFALVRYNANGSLDTSFSGDGKQTTDFGCSCAGARAVAIQGDGKIVAAGAAGANSDLAVARYNADGSLDTSFSGDGEQTTDFGSYDQAYGVALQSDGKIVAVGSSGTTAVGVFVLARYNPNGSLDTTFSGDGKQTTDFGDTRDTATGVALQSDGKIVAAGNAEGRAPGADFDDFALARYDPNGTLDTSFSGDGMQTTDFGGNDVANGVALQANGRIVAVGRGIDLDGFSNFELARYLGG
jgi:uncharacterized delta-60 repeat protein